MHKLGMLAVLLLAACGDGGGAAGADDRPDFANGDAIRLERGAGPLTIVNEGGGGVAAVAGFVRPAPEGAASTAGYASLQASGDDALVGASAPGFGVVELHEVTEADGVSRMRRVDRIDLPDGEVVRLEPGGYHLMMMRPQRVLAEGDTLPVTLVFESGATLTLEQPVANGPGGHHGRGH